MPETTTFLVPGSRIGPYEVIGRLGRGGMATVYLARAAESCPVPMGRQVAVKVLSAPDGEERKRFAREARYLSSLQHPGIVRVLDTGEDDQQAWLVMPLVVGRRLDELAEPGQGPLSEARIIDLGIQALEALHVAHLAGILHRDIKPANLMLDGESRVRVLDFGLAAAPDRESRLTREGDVVGTPAYMAPEQASGRREDVGRRTDLYAVGACLYELVTARQPFIGANTMAVLRAVIEDDLEPPSRYRPDLSRDLETVIMVAMAKEPRDRYRTAEEMASDLRRISQGRRVQARQLSPLVRGARAAWRMRRTIALIGLALFLVVAGAAVAIRHALRPPPAPVAAVPDNTWLTATAMVAPAGEPAGLQWTSNPALAAGLQMVALNPVEGPVRLAVTVELADPAAAVPPVAAAKGILVELMVSDRDLGAGYHLRLAAAPAGDRLELLREERVVASRDLGRLPRPARISLMLENDDGGLKAQVGPEGGLATEVVFRDLVPLSGGEANGVFLARDARYATVRRITLDRRRSGEYVSALAKADLLRQDRRWARALQLYQAFLVDHPDSEKAVDAQLRLGLCYEALGDLPKALAAFERLVRDHRNQPEYVLEGTFHAWTCQLRLGQYAEADASFRAVRQDPLLLTAIPESALRDLRADHQERAAALAASDTDQALTLAMNASVLAELLGETDHQADALLLAGDLLLAQARPEVARETWRRLDGDDRIDPGRRVRALLGRSIAERLLDDNAAALASCRAALELNANTTLVRFWLGDLLERTGDAAGAHDQWTAAGLATPLGRLCARMASGLGPLPAKDPLQSLPEAAYAHARLAEMHRDHDAATWLARAAAGSGWGAALARGRLVVP